MGKRKRVFMFSSGASSAMMTLSCDPTDDDIILFTDTCREHLLSYKFIDDFERYEGLKVHRACYTKKNAPGLKGFDALLFGRKDVPNVFRRECTKELKVRMAQKYLRSLGVTSYDRFIGFRADEPQRIIKFKERDDRITTFFPLNELGVTVFDVNKFWQSKPYRLETPKIWGNCDFCFLKGKATLIKLMAINPEGAKPWIDNEHTHRFIKDMSYAQMLQIAKTQKNRFDVGDLDDLKPAYSCSCNNF